MTSNEPIFFDGRLLKLANVDISDLEATINFTIHLQNHQNEDYFYHLSLPIHLENKDASIYEGSVLVENQYENAKFIPNF